MNRWGSGFVVILGVCVLAAPVLAQAPVVGDVAERSTEFGIRFTPGMARAMGRAYAENVLVSRYKIDPALVEDATESVAMRFMELAHRLDDAGYAENFEQMVEQIMAGQLQGERMRGVSPQAGKAISEALKPAMPAIRDLVRGVAQDVRPMLAPKEQLRFGTDLLAFNAGLNAFDETLDRWGKGDVQPGENPFLSGGKPKLDASGHSAAYNAAQKRALQDIEKGEWDEWKSYVEDAVKLYGLDEAQAAAAHSILNESLGNAAQYTRSEQWRRQVERNRLWASLLDPMQIGRVHPLRYALQREYGQMLDPIHAIGEEMKRRIDAIPMLSQRRAADERILRSLGEQGYVETSGEDAEGMDTAIQEPARSTPPPQTEVFDEKGSANDESAARGGR